MTGATSSRISVVTGDVPVEGFWRPTFRWRDVFGAPPPEPAAPGFCVPGPEVVAGSERVEQALLVRTEGGAIVLEHRLGVAPRVLAGAIVAERRVVGEGLADVRPRWLARGARKVTRGLATAPDRIRKHARKTLALLSTPAGRARFRQGLVEPRALTGEQKAVTLFACTTALVATLLLAHVVVTLVAPHAIVAWRTGLFLFVWGYVGSLGIPLPWEPALLAAALVIGPWITILVGVAAKLAAGYMVFFVGDSVNAKLEARAERSPRFDRFLRWSERFARRFGVLAIALFIATPGLPDLIALYVFGSLRMPLWKFFAGLTLGALVLDGAALFGALKLIGIG